MVTSKITSSLFLLLFATALFAQNIEQDRIVNWSEAGLSHYIQNDNLFIDFMQSGGDNSGENSNSELLQDLINDAEYGTTIYFEEGQYFFAERINLKSGISLQGASSQNTQLIFDLDGNYHCINAIGTLTQDYIQTSGSLVFKSDIITVTGDIGDLSGKHFLMVPEDQNLVTSTWAIGTSGQVIQIAENSANEIKIESQLRRNFQASENVVLQKMEPIENVWISDLSIQRLDETTTQRNNIFFKYAYNSGVSCIKSYHANFAHIAVSSSHHISISSSLFKDGFSYGQGGKAYGVVLQNATSQSKVFNNSFDHLRHSMLLQAGANGNVVSYNYSKNPHWESGFLPADSAGEIVLHGNYPYANLFEGNIVGNIVVDDSHGINGPNNTFFRNRADGYGFFTALINPTDALNLIGNEVKNTNPGYGLFSINGDDHSIFANVINTECQEEEVNNMSLNSLYTDASPFDNASINWPVIAYPNEFGIGINASQLHTDNGEDLCAVEITSNTTEIEKTDFTIFPNPTNGFIEIASVGIDVQNIVVLNQVGQTVYQQQELSSNQLDVSHLSDGVYRMVLVDLNGKATSQQMVVQR